MSLSREGKIAYLTAVLIASFIFTTFYYYYQGYYLKQVFPFNTFLVNGLFGDFALTWTQWKAAAFGSVGFGMSYFPAMYLFVDLLARIPAPDGNRASTVLVALFSVWTCIYSYLNLKTHSVVATIRDTVICTFMVYPFLFILATANLEGIVFVFLCLFVYLYQRGHYALSALALAVCIATKLFPAVFLILFIADRKYRELLYVIGYTLALSLLPLLIFPGGILGGFAAYLTRFSASQKMYFDLMVVKFSGDHYGHSLFTALHLIFNGHLPRIEVLLGPYLAFSAVVFSVLALYLIFIERVFWKRIAVLTITMCLLPYVSTDYRLIHFLIPLYLFINYRAAVREKSLDKVYIVLFALLLIPKLTFIYLWGDGNDTLNVILTPAIMLVILLLIIGSKFRMMAHRATSP